VCDGVDLTASAHALVALLMLDDRVGSPARFSVLALRECIRRHELPEKRTIVG
jgi:hypothetical protein